MKTMMSSGNVLNCPMPTQEFLVYKLVASEYGVKYKFK